MAGTVFLWRNSRPFSEAGAMLVDALTRRSVCILVTSSA